MYVILGLFMIRICTVKFAKSNPGSSDVTGYHEDGVFMKKFSLSIAGYAGGV